jgi:(S)-ureidoglycine aminohydrolase
LIAQDGLVPSDLPGWQNATAYVVISPAMGSRVLQLHIDLAAGGSGVGETGENELFIYALSGAFSFGTGGGDLEAGGYVYLPPGTRYHIAERGGAASLLIFEKKYEPLIGSAAPAIVSGNERDIAGAPFLGDPSAMLQVLLPQELGFDMAVNIFKYAPGATLPFVETHVMEHGLLMLAGEGIYRLEDSWYPVRAGDAIWMAPYCPQWFVATGKAPASYIYYKDVNRWPGP